MKNNDSLNYLKNITLKNKNHQLFSKNISIYFYILIAFSSLSILLLGIFIIVFFIKINTINKHVRSFYDSASFDDFDSLGYERPIVMSINQTNTSDNNTYEDVETRM